MAWFYTWLVGITIFIALAFTEVADSKDVQHGIDCHCHMSAVDDIKSFIEKDMLK